MPASCKSLAHTVGGPQSAPARASFDLRLHRAASYGRECGSFTTSFAASCRNFDN